MIGVTDLPSDYYAAPPTTPPPAVPAGGGGERQSRLDQQLQQEGDADRPLPSMRRSSTPQRPRDAGVMWSGAIHAQARRPLGATADKLLVQCAPPSAADAEELGGGDGEKEGGEDTVPSAGDRADGAKADATAVEKKISGGNDNEENGGGKKRGFFSKLLGKRRPSAPAAHNGAK